MYTRDLCMDVPYDGHTPRAPLPYQCSTRVRICSGETHEHSGWNECVACEPLEGKPPPAFLLLLHAAAIQFEPVWISIPAAHHALNIKERMR